MESFRHVLSSGQEVLIIPKTGAHVVSVQVYVWAGSLHERPNERGAAHFIEHMLFKGTPKRKVGEIGSLVEGAGGDINAYTTFDRTVYYLTLPSAQLALGLDVLADAVFQSTFDAAELEREREVILEEIRRGLDDPGAVIGKKIFALMYQNSEAGRPIIGSEESVSQMSRDDLLGFYQRYYKARLTSVVVVGDVDPDSTLDLVKEYFPQGTHAPKTSTGAQQAVEQAKAGGVAVIKGEYEQTRLEIAFAGPSMTELDGVYVDLAAYILGGSEISRLQRRLRDRDQLVSAIGCSAYSPSFRGVVEVSAAVDPEHLEAAARGIGRELGLFLSSEPPTQKDLERAAAAFLINRIHRDETVDGLARAQGVSLMTPFKERFEAVYERLVNEATPQQVVEGLRRSFSLEQVAIVALGGNDLAISEVSLQKAFADGWTSGFKPVTPTESKAKTAQGAQIVRINLANGMPLIYRYLPDAQMFCLMSATEGGLRYEDTPRAGIFHATAGMLGLATKSKSYDDFSGRLEDLGSVVSGFSGKDSCGWEVHSILSHAEETLALWADGFLNPRIPTEQWESQKRETMHTFKMQADSGSYLCMRLLAEGVYGSHPYAAPLLGWPETVAAFEAETLEQFYQAWRDGGPWIIAASGGLPPDKLTQILNKNLGTWRPQFSLTRATTVVLTPRTVASTVPPKLEKEQAHIALGWKGLTWKDPARASLDVAMNVLGGHGGRLFFKLRDQQSLAYTVSPMAHQGRDLGLAGAYLACKPDKIQQALEGIRREIRDICDHLVPDDELERAKQYILGSHEIGLQRTSSQAMTMGLMELYGVGWDDFKRYPSAVQNVTALEVKRVCEQIFASEPPVEIIVGG